MPLLVFQVWASGVCESLEVVCNILCLCASEKFSGERILEFHHFPKELHGLWKVKNHSWQIFCHWKWVRWGAEDNDSKINCPQLQLTGVHLGIHRAVTHLLGPLRAWSQWALQAIVPRTLFWLLSARRLVPAFSLLHLSHYSVLSLIVKATLQGRKHYGVERLGREWKHHMFYSKNKVRRWTCEGNKKSNAVTKAIEWQWC